MVSEEGQRKTHPCSYTNQRCWAPVLSWVLGKWRDGIELGLGAPASKSGYCAQSTFFCLSANSPQAGLLHLVGSLVTVLRFLEASLMILCSLGDHHSYPLLHWMPFFCVWCRQDIWDAAQG